MKIYIPLAAFAAASLLHSAPTQHAALYVRNPGGDFRLECPLKHTDVKAEISGFISRVTVTQDFRNDASDKIDATYVFPLPHDAAVDDMTLQVGDRTVRGTIRKREEAQAIYDSARNAGKVAALLDSERPNIFTQSVANIAPGASVRIIISYVARLKYEAGTFEFVFPMVVGPRYIPGGGGNNHDDRPRPLTPGAGWKWDTAKVPEASRIVPPVAPPGMRAGHDISLELRLDAGVPLQSVSSSTHDVATVREGQSRAVVRLKNANSIPNKDFVLRYDVSGEKIADAVLTHSGARGGFFTLILQPPDRLATRTITPKEIVFVLDTSGSMDGFPIEKAKEAMNLALGSLNPGDTFNLITFAGDTTILFPQPVPATAANLARAREFLNGRRGGGGTEMMKAIRAALDSSDTQGHIRVVCFMTDGYVGDDREIIAEVGKHPNARVFSFGIGNSVNRYLLDKMAEAGRGEVEYVALNDDGSAAARRFSERVANPVLTDISVEWNGLPVTDVLPGRIPDLFSAKPLVITGRYTGAARGTIRLRGKIAGAPISREIAINLPANEERHDVLAALWANTKIDSLATPDNSNRELITKLGLDYRLMTAFTSFVAVEETTVTEGGKARRVQVPVELPDGVSYDGIFGRGEAALMPMGYAPTAQMSHAAPMATFRSKVATGVQMAVMRESAGMPPPPVRLDPELAKLAGPNTVKVMVLLRNAEPGTLEALKKLGFEVLGRAQSPKVLIGRVAADKLKALSELEGVKWVTKAP